MSASSPATSGSAGKTSPFDGPHLDRMILDWTDHPRALERFCLARAIDEVKAHEPFLGLDVRPICDFVRTPQGHRLRFRWAIESSHRVEFSARRGLRLERRRGMAACATLAVAGEALLIGLGGPAVWRDPSNTDFLLFCTTGLLAAMPLLAGAAVARRQLIAFPVLRQEPHR